MEAPSARGSPDLDAILATAGTLPRPPGMTMEVDAIIEALRNAWKRLSRKQMLFAYPLTLGVVNTAIFLAVYSTLGGRLAFSQFVETNFTRWTFLQDHRSDLTSPDHLLVVIVAAVAVCLLAAAVRAPFFRAIAGSNYPLGPRSSRELLNLAGFYAVTNTAFFLVPFSFAADSAAGQIVSYALLPVALLLIFGDYALVFEKLSPLAAIRRSVRLAIKGWWLVIPIYFVALLLWMGSFAMFDRYYQTADGVFPLFFLSQLLVEALVTLVLDVVLIYTYDHLRR